MSTLTLVEQTNPGVQSAGQQKIYPKSTANQSPNGALARVDSTGTERIIVDSGHVLYATGLLRAYYDFGGV